MGAWDLGLGDDIVVVAVGRLGSARHFISKATPPRPAYSGIGHFQRDLNTFCPADGPASSGTMRGIYDGTMLMLILIAAPHMTGLSVRYFNNSILMLLVYSEVIPAVGGIIERRVIYIPVGTTLPQASRPFQTSW